MKTFLCRMKVLGVKNIEKELTIDFCDSTIKKKFTPNKTNVTAVYGMNGVGKSAIVNSIELYLNIVRDNSLSTNTKYFEHLINKKTNEFFIELTFLVYKDSKVDTFKHIVNIVKADNEYIIKEESLHKLIGRTLNEEFKCIIKTNNGVLTHLDVNSELYDKINSKLINISKYASITKLLFNNDYQNEFNNDKDSLDLYIAILSVSLFNCSLNYYNDIQDSHVKYQNYYQSLIEKYKQMDLLEYKNLTIDNMINFDVMTDIVNKNKAEIYERSIAKLEKFIKIFKPTLLSIRIDKKDDGENYRYDKFMCYSDYEVNIEFESTGIKKLIKLFTYFENIKTGQIVFIDELDANLHDVYLSKLIEYVSSYTDGQLIFTSHNLSSMKEMHELKMKNSIYFLSDNGSIYKWTRNGTYKPYDQYRNGYIEGSPFNIQDFDFIEVFGE